MVHAATRRVVVVAACEHGCRWLEPSASASIRGGHTSTAEKRTLRQLVAAQAGGGALLLAIACSHGGDGYDEVDYEEEAAERVS